MEILPGVDQIEVNYKGRPLQLYLLRFGGKEGESMLMDCGDAGVPGRDVLPYFEKIGFNPKRLTYVLLTHPDLDHVGGIHAMKEAAPQAQFMCGALDREQIETPEGLADIRGRAHYYWHGLGMDDAKRAAFIENAGGAGKRLEMARTFVGAGGGETFRLGDRELKIMHVPGHSQGHLGVFLPSENAAIIGDAVHGTANRFLDGKAAFACTYMWVDAYLGTIERLQAMKLDRLYSCHWPNCTEHGAVSRFLEESRAYALRAEGVILETVRRAGAAGMTMREVCLRAKVGLGDWPAEKDLETRSMACGHLQRLVDWGLLRRDEGRPTQYFAEEGWRGLR
jgi:glyoxylase-like metal-dependent hydrolase (beta-lactamase superfamily II)